MDIVLTGIKPTGTLHIGNYVGAIKNLNKVEVELAKITKDTPGFEVSSLRERELTYTNSMILHEHYFANLGGDGKPGPVDKRLAAAFGSTAKWEELFRATAMSLGGGSGWVVLDLNFATGDLRIYGMGGHPQSVAFGQPLLVLHAEGPDLFGWASSLTLGLRQDFSFLGPLLGLEVRYSAMTNGPQQLRTGSVRLGWGGTPVAHRER